VSNNAGSTMGSCAPAHGSRSQEIVNLMLNRARLESESDKLLAAQFADAIDLPTLKRNQDRIRALPADVNQLLAEHDEHHTGGRVFLHDSLRLLTDAHRAYPHSDGSRRARLDITGDKQLRPRLAEPFSIIREAHEHSGDEEEVRNTNKTHQVMSHLLRKTLWVDLRREFENPCPPLKTLSLRRSRGFYDHDRRSSEPTVSDSRGRVVRSLGMAQTLLRPEQVDDLVAQYREGATLVELASIFGVNRRTVAMHLSRREVTIRRGRFDPSRIHEAADLYLSGLTLVEVGMRVGVGPQAVRQALASHGVVIRPGGGRRSRITASAAVGG